MVGGGVGVKMEVYLFSDWVRVFSVQQKRRPYTFSHRALTFSFGARELNGTSNAYDASIKRGNLDPIQSIMHHIPPIAHGRPRSTPRKERRRRGIPPQHPLDPVRPRHAKLAPIRLGVRPHVANSQVGLPLGRRLRQPRVIPLALCSVNTCPATITNGEKTHIRIRNIRRPTQKEKDGHLDQIRRRVRRIDHTRVKNPNRRDPRVLIDDRVRLRAAAALARDGDARGVDGRIVAGGSRDLGDPVDAFLVQGRVGVGGLGDAVGVGGAVGGAVGDDEDAVGGEFFEEEAEDGAVVGAAGLTPDEDGELEVGGGVGGGEDGVSGEGRVDAVGLVMSV